MADGIYTDSFGIGWGDGGTPLFDLSATVGINASAFESGIKSIASSMESLGGDIEDMIEAVEGIADTASSAMDDLATDATDAAAEIQNALGDLTGDTEENSEGIAGALETVKTAFSGAAKSTEESAEAMKESAEGAGDAADDLEESTEKMEESAEDAASGFDALKEAASAAWDGIKNVAAAVWEIGSQLVDAAANYEQSMRVYRTAFEGVEEEAAAALKELSDETGLYEGIIRDSISRIQTQFRSAGYGQADALDMSRRAMLLAADAAAHYGISMDDATSRVLSFLRGNFEGGEIIGLSYSAATRDAYVQDKYGRAWKDLDEATRQSVLLEMAEGAYANAGVTGASGRMSDSFNFAWSNLMAQWNDIMGKLGTPIMEAVASVLDELASVLETPEMQEAIEDFIGVFEEIMQSIADIFVSFVKWVGTEDGQKAIDAIMRFVKDFFSIFGFIERDVRVSTVEESEYASDPRLQAAIDFMLAMDQIGDAGRGTIFADDKAAVTEAAAAFLSAGGTSDMLAKLYEYAWQYGVSGFAGSGDMFKTDMYNQYVKTQRENTWTQNENSIPASFYNWLLDELEINAPKQDDFVEVVHGALREIPGAIAAAMSGITVQMDGRTVGHLVAPTVMSDMARNSKFGQYTTAGTTA